MNGKRFLLDTNIVIGLFANEQAIINNIMSSETIFIPTIVIGELYYGAEQSSKKNENIKKIDEFASNSFVLECSTETAKQYGSVKCKLKLKGTPIPENDIWIAAMAIQNDLTLITRDKHFNHVEGLYIEKW
ncbi:MAG: type II toxin-antitoxin system VapC family toxin [Cytophagaceae bacterium]